MRLIVLAGALSLAAAGRAGAQGSDFEWKGKLAQGKTIEIRGVNGDVRAMTTAGSGGSHRGQARPPERSR